MISRDDLSHLKGMGNWVFQSSKLSQKITVEDLCKSLEEAYDEIDRLRGWRIKGDTADGKST